MKSNESNETEVIKVLSLRIYKRIIMETHISPIRLEPNIYNDKFIVWVFPYDEKILKILEEEKNSKGGK